MLFLRVIIVEDNRFFLLPPLEKELLFQPFQPAGKTLRSKIHNTLCQGPDYYSSYLLYYQMKNGSKMVILDWQIEHCNFQPLALK